MSMLGDKIKISDLDLDPLGGASFHVWLCTLSLYIYRHYILRDLSRLWGVSAAP